MKPVNFLDIDNKSQKTPRRGYIKFLKYIFPFVILMVFISIDYYNLNSEITNLSIVEPVSEKEMQSLLTNIDLQEKELNHLKANKEYLDELTINKEKESKLIEVLHEVNKIETDNTFITSIDFDREVIINGNSIDKDTIFEWQNILKSKKNILQIKEINYSDGYYTFLMVEGGIEGE